MHQTALLKTQLLSLMQGHFQGKDENSYELPFSN